MPTIRYRHHNNATVAARPSTRSTGGELRAMAWLARHPLFLLIPAAIVAALHWWGPTLGGFAVAVVPVALLVWWRAHPPSYDRFIAPRIRSGWRRWTAYRGRRWAGLLADCELTRHQHGTGRPLVPRILRVRAVTPSIDLLRVRMVRGQHADMFTEHAPALADALGAHRVSVTRARPGVLALVIERRMPFTSIIPATTMPTTVEEIDLSGLDVGDTETGAPFRLPSRGQHWLVVGRTGGGKSSLIYNPWRALAPMIRDGLVRLWVVDLKGGTETDRASALYHRWATTGADAVELLTDFRDSMKSRQEQMRADEIRQAEITRETPWELLVIDEMAMLTAYGDRHEVRESLRLLSEVLTQGRAADHTVWGYVQEPTKDVVDVRDLFTVRVCLAVTAASHVDMALGDGARDRGALADQIPGGPDHAGIGFVIDDLTRAPIRFRAGLVTDRDIDELVSRSTPGTRYLTALPTSPDDTDDDQDDDGEEYAS
ncbi:FtsK/SpoIIIE domain-containing protein [Pseudonocardia hydrocarbonoxydans]|uniref:Cell division protein FtsK n=1 Tax=Pseudonocardia hydrocarbonoxydans TaxID=76726 RepID=A0A4Y3WQI2_9PSEU|nr:FtsK/SpoIIIE domain-containing protein [Pseudonocardia hydrocarbonoxydans]GEC20541.1 cell division protein FtsK [Pseudonocardia hydrocarbonoxydans]